MSQNVSESNTRTYIPPLSQLSFGVALFGKVHRAIACFEWPVLQNNVYDLTINTIVGTLRSASAVGVLAHAARAIACIDGLRSSGTFRFSFSGRRRTWQAGLAPQNILSGLSRWVILQKRYENRCIWLDDGLVRRCNSALVAAARALIFLSFPANYFERIERIDYPFGRY